MTSHELKIRKEFADRLRLGRKTAEIRKNDRDFKVNDFVVFRVVDAAYWDCPIVCKITDILTHEEFPEGLQPGYVMLSFRPRREYKARVK